MGKVVSGNEIKMNEDYSQQVWDEFAKAYKDPNVTQDKRDEKRKQLFTESIDRVRLIQKARFADRAAAVSILKDLSTEELLQLFPELIALATVIRYVEYIREIIKSLPREWVLEHIEEETEKLLAAPDTDYSDYRRILELYEELDNTLVVKLARQAAASTDPDIKEAGEYYLEK